jgi:hypothetical protein
MPPGPDIELGGPGTFGDRGGLFVGGKKEKIVGWPGGPGTLVPKVP